MHKVLRKALGGTHIHKEAWLTPILARHFARQNFLQGELEGWRHATDRAEMRRTIAALTQLLKTYNHGLADKEEKLYFHPSSIGRCPRQLWLAHFNAPTEPEAPTDIVRRWVTLTLGSNLHLALQNACEAAGVLEQREVPLVDHDYRIIGHADGILTLRGVRVLLEIKTINSRRFTEAQITPTPEYVWQLTCYQKVLGLKHACLFYVCKDTGATAEHVLPYSPTTWEMECLPRINQHLKAVKQKRLPARPFNTPTRFPCSFCPYVPLCFTNKAAENFARTVQ